MRKNWLTAAVLAMGMTMLPVALAGQVVTASAVGNSAVGEQVFCMWCHEEGGEHHFEPAFCGEPNNLQFAALEGTPAVSLVQEEEFECSRCGGESSCHMDPDPGGCHLPCDMGGGGGSLTEVIERMGDLQQVIAMAPTAEAVAAMDALIEIDQRLVVNQSRNSVQMLDCQGAIVAQWLVTDDVTAELVN